MKMLTPRNAPTGVEVMSNTLFHQYGPEALLLLAAHKYGQSGSSMFLLCSSAHSSAEA
jgi:hypothetical protein